MRKILTAVAFFLASLTPVLAQGFIPAGAPPWVYADSYGRWAIQGQQANTWSFSPASACQVTQLNFKRQSTFFAFGSTVALAPVFVADVNGAKSEVVTPGSAATQTQEVCSVNISPVNSHTTFTLQSGSGGLQEAINTLGGTSKTVPYTIILSPEWYKLIQGISSVNATLTQAVTPADVISNATCTSNIQVIDVTANPWAYYGCNGSGKLTPLTPQKPTIAAGAGAGTSPTIALLAGSNNSTGTVTLTTGTSPTASAAIFTLTFSAPDYGGVFPYAPACSFTSVGSTAYTTGTPSSTAGSGTSGGTGVLTASATALTASTSGYKFTYSCH